MSCNCFKKNCKDKARYICRCLSETFYCEIHLKEHLKIPNRSHSFDSVFSELQNWTKEGILEFLEKENLKKKKLKDIALACFTKISDLNKNNICKSLKDLDCDIKEISDLIIKITKVSEEEEALLLNLLTLPPDFDAEKIEEMLQNGSDSNISLFCRLSQLKNKTFAILNTANIDLKLELDFRRTCALYQNNANHWLLRQAYKEYVNAYQHLTSLYRIKIDKKGINLFKYNTESEKEYVKILENQHEIKADIYLSVKLPNGEFFIHGGQWGSKHIAFIIDKNYRIRWLPIGDSEFFAAAIYFNKSIYCFGWYDFYDEGKPLFKRFDLDENRWIKLALIVVTDRYLENLIIFNGSILTSLQLSWDLLLYSIDIDSFSTIPYRKKVTEREKIRKCHYLISSKERLYLIESKGWIYESEANDQYNWKKISVSGIHFDAYQIHFSYNKGGIYLLFTSNNLNDNFRMYAKFDLGKKEIIEIACYDNYLALKKVDGKLKAIEGYRQSLKLDSDEIKNGYTLYYIFTELSQFIRIDHKGHDFLQKKGDLLNNLGWYLEALECYNKSTQLDAKNASAYIGKGNALRKLDRNIEALKCYNTAIRLNPFDSDSLLFKGLVLSDLGKNLEAIECYSSVVNFDSDNSSAYFHKGVALHYLGRDAESIECYKIVIQLNSNYPRYFIYHSYLLNDIEQYEDAIQDFNTAYCLMILDPYRDSTVIYNCLKLLKMLSKLLKSTVEFKVKFEKLKNSQLRSQEKIKETEEKELIIKQQCSQLIKRAVECLYFHYKFKPIEEIQQIIIKVSEHQKEIDDAVIQLAFFETFTSEGYNENL